MARRIQMNTRQWMLTIAVAMAVVGAALSIAALAFKPSKDLGTWVQASLTALSACATTAIATVRFKAVGQESAGPIVLTILLAIALLSVLIAASVAALSVAFLVRARV